MKWKWNAISVTRCSILPKADTLAKTQTNKVTDAVNTTAALAASRERWQLKARYVAKVSRLNIAPRSEADTIQTWLCAMCAKTVFKTSEKGTTFAKTRILIATLTAAKTVLKAE